MFLHQRFIPGLAIYSYMVGDEKTKECAVIDPTRDVDYFIDLAEREGLRITHVLETHVHADFVSGSRELKARLDDDPLIACSGPRRAGVDASLCGSCRRRRGRRHAWAGSGSKPVIRRGTRPSTSAWALYDDTRSTDTPWLIFTGDFVFVGDVGRPDLLGEDARRVTWRISCTSSVFDILPAFPDFTEIFPGPWGRFAVRQGYRFARGLDPRLRAAVQRVLSARRRSGLGSTPARRHAHRPAVFPPHEEESTPRAPRWSALNCPGGRGLRAEDVHDRVCDHCLIVDVRPKEAFAASHIPGAINIPLGAIAADLGRLGPSLRPARRSSSWTTRPTCRRSSRTCSASASTTCGATSKEGMDAWQTAGFETARLQTISVHELAVAAVGRTTRRSCSTSGRDREWDDGHIDGARHIHGGLLQERIDLVPRDREVAVVCGTGTGPRSRPAS